MTIGFDNTEVIASFIGVFSGVKKLIGSASRESKMRKLMSVEWVKYWLNEKNGVLERIP